MQFTLFNWTIIWNIFLLAIHAATEEAGCISQHRNAPKPYWCPELRRLIGDKKIFWWRLWVDNGRPRMGVVLDSYKYFEKRPDDVLTMRSEVKRQITKVV